MLRIVLRPRLSHVFVSQTFPLAPKMPYYSMGTAEVNHCSYTLLFLQVEYISRRHVQTSQQ
jgi:hypothetical protein